MAIQEIRISELPDAAPIQGDELLEMVQGGENVKVRADQLGGGGGGGDASTVTLNFEGVDPADDGQWVPVYTDFPDNTKLYKGTVNLIDVYGGPATYTASYFPAFGAWLVEMAYRRYAEEPAEPLAYLTSANYQGILMGHLDFSINTGLPAGITRFEGHGLLDMRHALGIPVTTVDPFEIELTVQAGYADVLLETPLYSSGDVPLYISSTYESIKDKLVDTISLFPTDLAQMLGMSEIFVYGFRRGAKYWEVSNEVVYDTIKLTVKSASDDRQTFRIPLTLTP